jgi:hypothetical protein
MREIAKADVQQHPVTDVGAVVTPGDERHVDDPVHGRDLDAGDERLSVDELITS